MGKCTENRGRWSHRLRSVRTGQRDTPLRRTRDDRSGKARTLRPQNIRHAVVRGTRYRAQRDRRRGTRMPPHAVVARPLCYTQGQSRTERLSTGPRSVRSRKPVARGTLSLMHTQGLELKQWSSRDHRHLLRYPADTRTRRGGRVQCTVHRERTRFRRTQAGIRG